MKKILNGLMQFTFHKLLPAIGKNAGKIMDQVVDTVFDPIESAFGVKQHNRTTIFQDAFESNKAKQAGLGNPEIDYAPMEAKAKEKKSTIDSILEGGKKAPAKTAEKDAAEEKDDGMVASL